MLSTKLKEAAGNSADATLYVDDVFSTYLYTGNGFYPSGGGQTIVNGIDLAGKGGLIWIKARNTDTRHGLYDTARGINQMIGSNNTDPQYTDNAMVSANSNGFTLGSESSGWGRINMNGNTYASWTFREAAKFFDVVTYTGDGVANRTISHSLGVAPGMIIVKRTDTAVNWIIYTNSTGIDSCFFFNTDSVFSSPGIFGNSAPTASNFKVGSVNGVNASGGTYVAYLYAHDTSSTGIIQCGSFTTDGSGNATVNLGWEPQFLLRKVATDVGNWNMWDTMRGFTASNSVQTLLPNLSNAEFTSSGISINSTGFIVSGFTPSVTAIYMAIRMPNKPPTSGTQVFGLSAFSGNSVANRVLPTGNLTDLSVFKARNAGDVPFSFMDRLRGSILKLYSYSTSAEEGANNFVGFDEQNGVRAIISAADQGVLNLSNSPYTNEILYTFKRASGFFDEVCWSGGGTWPANHNLSVSPELIIIKSRLVTSNWYVCVKNTYGYEVLQTTAAAANTSQPAIDVIGGAGSLAQASATLFNVSTFGLNTGVAYLFATLAGISKVGSYTGNGTGQAIACGFSAGARFVLIKRTDSTGDWYTFDSARGLTVGSSPYLLLNSRFPEVTGDNGVYASTGGFTLATSAAGLNASGGTYIFLAVA